MTKSAFEIISIEAVNGNWVLHGRAWETVRLTDVLIAEYIDTGNLEDRRFTVVGIESYRHTLDELYRMMTGSLTVSGQRGDLLLPETKLMAETDS
jgi:hypothetical protein